MKVMVLFSGTQKQLQTKLAWLSSIWFLWPTLTISYLLGYTVLFLGGGSTVARQGTTAARLLGFLGLLVPFGFWNTLYTIGALWSTNPDVSPARILLWPAALVAMWVVNRATKRAGVGWVPRLCANLGLLVVLTIAVDLALYHEWRSLIVFATGNLLGGTHF